MPVPDPHRGHSLVLSAHFLVAFLTKVIRPRVPFARFGMSPRCALLVELGTARPTVTAALANRSSVVKGRVFSLTHYSPSGSVLRYGFATSRDSPGSSLILRMALLPPVRKPLSHAACPASRMLSACSGPSMYSSTVAACRLARDWVGGGGEDLVHLPLFDPSHDDVHTFAR